MKKKANFFKTFGSGNIYDTAEVIFSLHKFISADIPVCRVRDSGDDSESDYTQAEADAGFTAIGSDSGYLVKLYDQIGTNSKGDLVQASTSLQPKVLNAGSGYLNNGKAYVKFDNTDLYLTSENSTSPFLDPTQAFTVYHIFKSQNVSSQDGVFEENGGGVKRVCLYSDTTSNNYGIDVANDGAANVLNNTSTISQNTIYMQTYKRVSTTSSAYYLNGVLQESHSWEKYFGGNTFFRLGKLTVISRRFEGEFAAILIFPEAHDDTTREAIESDLTSIYSIP